MSLLIPIWRCLHLHSVWKAKAGEHHEVKASLSYVQTTDWDCFAERTATAAWVTILTAGSVWGSIVTRCFSLLSILHWFEHICNGSVSLGWFVTFGPYFICLILTPVSWGTWLVVGWILWSVVVSFTSWAILSLYLLKYSLGPLVPRLLLRAATPASSHAACHYSEGLSPFSLCVSVSLIFVVQLFLLAFLPARYPFSLCHICHL